MEESNKEEIIEEEEEVGKVEVIEEEVEAQPHEVFVDEFRSLISDEYFQNIKDKQGSIVRKLQSKTEHVNMFNEKMKKQYVTMKSDFQAHISMMKEMKEDLKYIQEKVALIKRKIESPPPPTFQASRSQSMKPGSKQGNKASGNVKFSKSL